MTQAVCARSAARSRRGHTWARSGRGTGVPRSRTTTANPPACRSNSVHRNPSVTERGLYAQLTDTGLDKVRAARATHHAGIRQFFFEHLTATDQIALGDIWGRVRDR